MRKMLLRNNSYIKKFFLFITILAVFLILFPTHLIAAPVELVKWDFNDQDRIADGGIDGNLSKEITKSFDPENFTFYQGTGSAPFAIAATNWDGGAGTKYWEIEFTTQNYSDLILSFSQRSSGTGPRDFEVQYKIGSTGDWSTFTSNASYSLPGGNGWGHHTFNLPEACNNKPSVYLRWIMTSNISANNGIVGSGGTNRITNIIVTGEYLQSQGKIIINKSIDNDINPAEVFTFEIDSDPVQQVQITGAGTAEFTGLSAGTYKIIETTSGFNTQVSPDNSTWSSGNSIDVTITGDIGSEDSKTVYFRNDKILSVGKITVSKIIGDDISSNQFFRFWINTSPPQTIQITGAGTAEFTGLSAGTYKIIETTSGFNTQVSPDNSTWSSGNSIDVTITGDIGSEDSKTVYFRNDKKEDDDPITIVAWNFNDEDRIADGGIEDNLSKEIILSFTPAIFTFYNGPDGAGTRAIAADSWNGGAGTKYWEIEFTTQNYSDLVLSFSQRSSDTGPRDFDLQYKIGVNGTYETFYSYFLPRDNFLNISNISLPDEANNQESVFIRWLMASETASNRDIVGPLGTNRITNIVITSGALEENIEIIPVFEDDETIPEFVEPFIEPVWVRTVPMTCYHVWINENNNFEFVFHWEYKNNNWVKIYDISENEVFSIDMPYGNARFEASLPDGYYNVKTFHDDFNEPLQEFLIGKP